MQNANTQGPEQSAEATMPSSSKTVEEDNKNKPSKQHSIVASHLTSHSVTPRSYVFEIKKDNERSPS